jgi:BirA family biotin operon repressor/biotin-[acetyl-CoA-carboxylase] ligase
LFTTVLPPIRSDALWAVPFWASLRVTEAIAAIAGAIPTLQWPNDLLLKDRKVCGVLSISRVSGEHADVGCGIGVNVQRPDDPRILRDVLPSPAFLSDVDPRIERETLLIAILNRFSHKLEDLNDPHQIARRWEKLAGFPGAPYRMLADGDGAPVECEALHLDASGALVTRIEGYERTFHAADASALRPHGE